MNRKANTTTFAIGACAFEVRLADGAIQIFPAGRFDAPRGAMAGSGPWKIDGKIAARLLAQLSARSNPLVVDYEHQTLRAADNGQPAPAAGWLSPDAFEWREGHGLYALDPDWTAAAKRFIEQGEYRFLSPVFTYDRKTGEVLDLLHVALTNAPAIDGMAELGLQAAAKFDLLSTNPQEPAMEQLLTLFGLKPDATEEDAIAALTQLQAENAKLKKDVEAAQQAVAAAKAETPETAVTAMRSMQAELAALREQVEGREIDELVTAALTAGKLVPAQEDWARNLGKSDMAALKGYIDTAQPIAALKGKQTDGKKFDEPGGSALTDEQLAVCTQLHVDPEEYKKTLASA